MKGPITGSGHQGPLRHGIVGVIRQVVGGWRRRGPCAKDLEQRRVDLADESRVCWFRRPARIGGEAAGDVAADDPSVAPACARGERLAEPEGPVGPRIVVVADVVGEQRLEVSP